MTNIDIKHVLMKNGVYRLYHSNTVETSLSFLKTGGMLSRGLCEDIKLPQTPQYTDVLDKKNNIYYDIFFDSVEIQKITGLSYYGPVLFVYKIEVLDTVAEGKIRITKLNPKNWISTMPDIDKYFIGFNDLNKDYNPHDFGQHITLTNQRQPLSFDYLEKIVLIDPKRDDNSIFEKAKSVIEQTLESCRMHIPFEIRSYDCFPGLYEYYDNSEHLNSHYKIGGHA